MVQPESQARTFAGNALNWVSKLDLLSFSALMGLAAVVARLPVAARYSIPQESGQLLLSHVQVPYVVGAFLIFPVIETALGQWLPVRLVSYLGFGKTAQVVVSAFAFCLLHLWNWTGAVTAFLPGLVLAYAYITWEHRARTQAFWVTVLAHAWEMLFVVGLRALRL
jgi:hypothetical protein